jgi:peptidoglycan hydrolase CwlO-like protein
MKTAYLAEYEANYQANVNDKNSHIKEIQNHIADKEDDISEKKEAYEALKHKIFTLLK